MKIPNKVFKIINELNASDIGVDTEGKWVICFEGFTDECWEDFEERDITMDDLEDEIRGEWKAKPETQNAKLVETNWLGDVFYGIFKKTS